MPYNVPIKVQLLLANRTNAQLIDDLAATENNHDENIPTVRGWLMDELEIRNKAAFDAWIDGPCDYDSLRALFAA